MAMRTKGGSPSAKARAKTGTRKGKYPIFDQKSCTSAVKLRHHGKGVSAGSVLARAAAWASRNKNAACRAAVKRAREADRKRRRSGKGIKS